MSQSVRQGSTSSKRVRAWKSYFSLKYSGASSRIRFQTGYGSLSIVKS